MVPIIHPKAPERIKRRIFTTVISDFCSNALVIVFLEVSLRAWYSIAEMDGTINTNNPENIAPKIRIRFMISFTLKIKKKKRGYIYYYPPVRRVTQLQYASSICGP